MPDLCQLADVKAWLNINNGAADALLERLITAVSADFLTAIERYDFTPAADFSDVIVLEEHHLTLPFGLTTTFFKGIGEFRVGLHHWPVNSIASVAIDGTAVVASAR